MQPHDARMLPQYDGSVERECIAVRQHVGMLDLSYQGVIDLLGAGARALLRLLLSRDVDVLDRTGQALRALLLNPYGGIIDEVTVYFYAADHYRVICSTTQLTSVLAWLHEHALGMSVGLVTPKDVNILMICGPHTGAVMVTMRPEIPSVPPWDGAPYQDGFVHGVHDTGGRGITLMLSADTAPSCWQQLLSQGVVPCGHQAHQILRMEAGYFTVGVDVDQHTSCYGSDLMQWVDDGCEREYIGQMSPDQQRPPSRRLIGLTSLQPLSAGQSVCLAEQTVGTITSQQFSYTLKRHIAYAWVDQEADQYTIKDSGMVIHRVATPFYPCID